MAQVDMVHAGQVYRDNDPRRGVRLLTVLAISGFTVQCAVTVNGCPTGKVVRISAGRLLLPHRNGYTLQGTCGLPQQST